jgi:hypothetical protein
MKFLKTSFFYQVVLYYKRIITVNTFLFGSPIIQSFQECSWLWEKKGAAGYDEPPFLL